MNDLSQNPLCKPFSFDGSKKHGLLLIHGFTATPGTMYPLGKSLAEQTGCYVNGILLPGHGATVEEMNKTGKRQWCQAVFQAFDDMQKECEKVSVVGLSMGGTLTLLLCEARPVYKAVPIAAALRVFNRSSRFANLAWPLVHYINGSGRREEGDFLCEYNESYDKTPVHCAANLNTMMHRAKRDLSKIHCPLLVARAGLDATVCPESADWIMQYSSSAQKQLLELKHSPHVCTLGPDRELLFQKTASFLTEE